MKKMRIDEVIEHQNISPINNSLAFRLTNLEKLLDQEL